MTHYWIPKRGQTYYQIAEQFGGVWCVIECRRGRFENDEADLTRMAERGYIRENSGAAEVIVGKLNRMYNEAVDLVLESVETSILQRVRE